MHCSTPADYFLEHFDDELLESFVYQTNLYVNQKQGKVSVVEKTEIIGFLGINLIMGYHKLPYWYHYWSTDQDLTVPLVSSTMPCNRFQQILSNLQINGNAMLPADSIDKLYKLRPLISKLNQNYGKLYNVSKALSIDDSMILFKGRSSLKQYNPKKPIKRGYKFWMRADMDG